MAKVLQELGYGKQLEDKTDEHTDYDLQNTDCDLQSTKKDLDLSDRLIQQYMPQNSDELQVKCLSVYATLPVHATDGSAGYDLFSAVDTQIQPNTRRNTIRYCHNTTTRNICTNHVS